MNYKGKLLIAKPILKDPFFSKSVIYITEYEISKGAVGFILNKKYDKKLTELISGIEAEIDVFIGGAVNQDYLFVVHSRPDVIEGGVPIQENLYWSGNYEQVRTAINEKLITSEEIKFFMGYSGWGEHQLETELENEDWLIFEDQTLNVLDWDENLWKNILIKIDKTNIIWMNSPINPELN